MAFLSDNWLIITLLVILVIILCYVLPYRKDVKKEELLKRLPDNMDKMKAISLKHIIPLKIQAYERLLFYVERIRFDVLVKRVYHPSVSKQDFQFSLLQNVQDEYEHNLAQRLYVTENTWQLIELSKDEVMQNINAVFNDNPDADVAMIAQKLASFKNPMAEKAVLSIKQEFNSL